MNISWLSCLSSKVLSALAVPIDIKQLLMFLETTTKLLSAFVGLAIVIALFLDTLRRRTKEFE
jgi:hypothetical protein